MGGLPSPSRSGDGELDSEDSSRTTEQHLRLPCEVLQPGWNADMDRLGTIIGPEMTPACRGGGGGGRGDSRVLLLEEHAEI